MTVDDLNIYNRFVYSEYTSSDILDGGWKFEGLLYILFIRLNLQVPCRLHING